MPGRKTFEAAMILAMAGLYFFSFFQRVAIPGAIFNDIQTQFSISATEVTRLQRHQGQQWLPPMGLTLQ